MESEPNQGEARARRRRLLRAQVYAGTLIVLGAAALVRTVFAVRHYGFSSAPIGLIAGFAILAIGILRWSDLKKLR